MLLFGSTLTGCALKDSNLNISIFHSQPSSICLPLIKTLKNSSNFKFTLNDHIKYLKLATFIYSHNCLVFLFQN